MKQLATKPSQLKKGKFKMNENEVILKSLQATIGKETIRKILEQFKEIAKNNNLDRSNNLLHDVLQIVEYELNHPFLENRNR